MKKKYSYAPHPRFKLSRIPAAIELEHVQAKAVLNGHRSGSVMQLLSAAKTRLIIFCSLLAFSAQSQEKSSEIDNLFNWASPATPGCVCAVSQHGKLVVNKAYGLADVERKVQMSTANIFDAGSLRKQFIAASILLLVEEKRLSLSDNVRRFIPQLPDYGYKITLDHLLTHTSGIRDWTGLSPLAGGDPDALTIILKQKGVNFAPGEEWSYSNSGYVLLAEIIERTTGMKLAEFTRKRLFEPLGMKSTRYLYNLDSAINNRALGYEKLGMVWKTDILTGNQRGGGGALFATAADLVTWNDALNSGKLGDFVTKKLQETSKLNNGRKISYARGLMVEPYGDSRLVSHSGGAAGYHSWLGGVPEKGLSVAVLCNSDAMAATTLGQRVLGLFLPVPPMPEAGAPPALPADVLAGIDKKTGLFINPETGMQMRLVVDRGRFRVAGGPGLLSVSSDHFRRWGTSVYFMSQDEFELHFTSPEQFELKTMEGKISRYRRVSPYAPQVNDLKAFAGRYQSDEIGGFFDITAGNDGLKVRANGAPGSFPDFMPVERDLFQLSGVVLKFKRDNTGKVAALEYSNPLVRKIKFSRLAASAGNR